MNAVRKAREALNLSVMQLEEESGVVNTSIYLAEDQPEGTPRMQLRTAIRLLRALPGLTLADLLREDPGRIRLR
jgi:hypothetical protein